MYVCMYVCIDSSARRPNHTEFEKTTEFAETTARWGAVRETSEERPGGVRGTPGKRPRSVREASEECPESARELSEMRPKSVPKAFVAKPGPRIKTEVRSRVELSDFFGQTGKSPSVVDDLWRCAFAGRRNECPRLCTTAALVQKVQKTPRLCRTVAAVAAHMCPGLGF